MAPNTCTGSQERRILLPLTQPTTSGQNPVQAIMGSGNSVLGLWGGHIVRDNFEITIKEQSLDRGYEVRFGKNLIGLDEEIDVTEVVTRIYPTAVINEPIVTALPEKYIDSPLIGTYPEPVIRELRVELTDTEKRSFQCLKFTILCGKRHRSSSRLVAINRW